MEEFGAVLGIVFFVGLVAVVMLLNKAKDAASKALTHKVIYKKKFEQGKHILKGFTFETTTSPSAVMQQLEKRVVTAEAPSGLTARLYVALRKPGRIDYVYGNKFSESFRVAVVLESRESGTLGVLKPVRWHEQEGIIVAQEWLGQLLDQVRAAVHEVDPHAGFVEGVHDSVQLTVPAEKAAPESDAWPDPESEPVPAPAPDATRPLVTPAAAASAAPAVAPASYSAEVTPIVPPTKANATWQWVGIAMVAGALLWIGVLGVRASMLPVWFAVLAGGGSIIYFADRAARKGRGPVAPSGEAPAPAAPSREAAAPAVESSEPTLTERLATDESEPDPYAWAEPKVEAPGSTPVTLNSMFGGLWNIVVGVALLGVGGWSLVTRELGIFPSLLMLGVGGYFLASRSFEGRIAVFVHRIADVAAGWLLAGAATVSSRVDSDGESVKPVVLARVVLAVVLILGLGYGIKGLSGVSGSPLAWIALLLGITPLWVWPALEKRVAQGTMSPAPPVRRRQPEKASAAVMAPQPSQSEELVFFEEELSEPVVEPAPEDFEAPVTADAVAGIGLPASNRRLILIGGAVVAVLVVAVVIASAISKPEETSATTDMAEAPAVSEDEDYETMADRPTDEVDPYTLSPDSHARMEWDLIGSAPEDGSAEVAQVVWLGGSQDADGMMFEFTVVSRDPAEWYQVVWGTYPRCYIDGIEVDPHDMFGLMEGDERVEGLVVFNKCELLELHVLRSGLDSLDAPGDGGTVVVPDHVALDLPYEEWEELEWGEAMEAMIAATEDAFEDMGLVAVVSILPYSGVEEVSQNPAAGEEVPVGTHVYITIPVVD